MRKVLAVGLVAAFALTVIPSLSASAETLEQRSLRLLNRERTSRGLRSLAWNTRAGSVARQHSRDMAADGELRHNRNLASQMDGWSRLGENVGTGTTVDIIHEAFMESTSHRENILDRQFVQIGVGVATDDEGAVWVTQVFFTPEKTQTTSARAQSTAKPASTWHAVARPARDAAPVARAHPVVRRDERKAIPRAPIGSRMHPLLLAIPFAR